MFKKWRKKRRQTRHYIRCERCGGYADLCFGGRQLCYRCCEDVIIEYKLNKMLERWERDEHE